ncbi:MAG: serine hydrolase [Planctomycetota bacterium]|nr:serine hydrolase [Planctomycetota bacterium]
MRHINTPIMLFTFCVLVFASLANARPIAQSDPEDILRSWVEVINAGDATQYEPFIREHFAPRLIEAYPMSDHVGMFEEIRSDYGTLTLHSIRTQTDDRIAGLIHTEQDQWLLVTLYVDPESGKLRGVGLDDGVDSPDVMDAPKATDLDSWSQSIQAYASGRAEKDQFSGTLLMQLDGQEVTQGVWGEASKRYHVPNNLDTKFNLGSMNKMFTAVCIAQLVQAGKLSYEDLVGKHLPDYPNSEVREKVTIHHLLSHTSGMGSHFTPEFIESAKDRYRDFHTYVDLFADTELAFEPGERFSYSNAGFFVMGLIIEALSDETYYEYVRTNLTGPAGMTNTDCYDLDLPVPNLATGYTQQQFDEPEREDHADWMDALGSWRANTLMHSVKGGPAGGGYSTVRDLGLFAKALTDGTLINAKQLKILTTPSMPVEPGGDGSTRGYGYGFGCGTLANGTAYFGHSGGFPGINSVLHIYPERNGFATAMSNYDGGASPIVSHAERVMPEQK